MNPITKTIMESLEEFDEVSFCDYNLSEGFERPIGSDIEVVKRLRAEHLGDAFYLVKNLKSHLLKSQIRLIEVWIEEMKSDKYDDPSLQLLAEDRHFEEAHNLCIDRKISSLNETLEFIKKSL